eukprot:3151647-Amphidinium_carterae.2
MGIRDLGDEACTDLRVLCRDDDVLAINREHGFLKDMGIRVQVYGTGIRVLCRDVVLAINRERGLLEAMGIQVQV